MGKRKAWVYYKDAKIPRTTAWRSNRTGNESTGNSLASDSMISFHHVEETTRPLCSFDNAALNDFESVNFFSSHPPSSPTNSDHVVDSLFCDDPSKEYSENEFHSVLIDTGNDSVVSDEESESVIERTDSSSSSECDSENESETSGVVEDFEMHEEETSDDNVPLYEGAKVSRLGALILVMLFSLRHQLSGQALIDLVKVLRALLPDGHKFIASAYLLKKYFADLFGEPAPKKHAYCGNCLGRIRKGQAACFKEKCRNAKKKIEYFLELDLHMRLCQLYRGKS